MDKQLVEYKDLGLIDYKTAWDYQEQLLQENVLIKRELAERQKNQLAETGSTADLELPELPFTKHHLLICEHPPVYTLGKSGHLENILISEAEMEQQGIQFYKINRGGDITFHGPQQVVGYPILDLEKFYTDIGRYLRSLEEVIILTLADYGIKGERSSGETGVWIEAGIKGKERKICAMGVRCSRWITMHGFAFNVNNDLNYFKQIIPCGIVDKAVTSLQKELGHPVNYNELKDRIKVNFEKVFDVILKDDAPVI